jgi:hypothetical protein
VDLYLDRLTAVPFVTGILFAKLKLLSGGRFRALSARCACDGAPWCGGSWCVACSGVMMCRQQIIDHSVAWHEAAC